MASVEDRTSFIFFDVITGGCGENIQDPVFNKKGHNGTLLLPKSSLDPVLTGPGWNGGQAAASSISVHSMSMKNGCSLMLHTANWRLSGDLIKSWKKYIEDISEL